MTRPAAIILWPFVFILDAVIGLIGKQSFKDARQVSKAHFKRIKKVTGRRHSA